MESNFNLQEHIAKGVERIVADTLKATLRDPRESAFMVLFAAAAARATKRRLELEGEGLHVPSFLIASITSACNLHCAGCYSRCNNATVDAEPCPFSPYSVVNVRELGVRGALQSPLFMALREGGVLDNDHVGGCVLYGQQDRVEKLLAGETA